MRLRAERVEIMKRYYASQDELGIKKGQRVYPREEALKMMNEKNRVVHMRGEFLNDKFFAKCKDGGWIIVLNENVPICVDDEKDAFREWLVKEISNAPQGYSHDRFTAVMALKKYDELNDNAPQEPKPLFEVGEKVVSVVNGETGIVLEIRKDKDGYGYRLERLLGIIPESYLRKAPKTKLVFSLEKWVEKRMKFCGAKHVVEHIVNWIKEDGKTVDEMYDGKGYYSSEPDLFVEVAE